MKTIGLIGGSTYVSTTEYYRTINQLTQQKLSGSNSASILMYSLNFSVFKELVYNNHFDEAADCLSKIAINLEKGELTVLLFVPIHNICLPKPLNNQLKFLLYILQKPLL